jgi:hypothetical protein
VTVDLSKATRENFTGIASFLSKLASSAAYSSSISSKFSRRIAKKRFRRTYFPKIYKTMKKVALASPTAIMCLYIV